MGDWLRRETEGGPDGAPGLPALMRGCALRAISWSIVAGSVLGACYVVLVVALFALPWDAPGSVMTSTVRLTGVLPFLPIGTVQGAIVGLVVGLANGCALAMAVRWLVRRRPIRQHGRLLRVVATATSILGLWVGRPVLGVPTLLTTTGAGAIVLGLALTGLGGWWVGDRVARWYLSEAASEM
ncbi:MAG: hypothetical protein IT340_07185 [Chloroflexi bacterium]|nr:hypothetical protein [Chloroflexota bacterium]